MLVGAVLLGFVGHEYWVMHREQQSLQRQWVEQQKPTAIHSNTSNDLKDDGLTRVSIPKINLDLIVVEGTNHKALRLGPGHLQNTPLPGDAGNSVISAHRDTFFRHIYELAKGDQIQIRRNGRTYTFAVMGKKIVEPNDMSVVRNSSDTRLTLITCYPTYYIGPAPQRLIVVAKLLDAQTQPGQRAGTQSAGAAGQGS
jgi:sortase A